MPYSVSPYLRFQIVGPKPIMYWPTLTPNFFAGTRCPISCSPIESARPITMMTTPRMKSSTVSTTVRLRDGCWECPSPLWLAPMLQRAGRNSRATSVPSATRISDRRRRRRGSRRHRTGCRTRSRSGHRVGRLQRLVVAGLHDDQVAGDLGRRGVEDQVDHREVRRPGRSAHPEPGPPRRSPIRAASPPGSSSPAMRARWSWNTYSRACCVVGRQLRQRHRVHQLVGVEREPDRVEPALERHVAGQLQRDEVPAALDVVRRARRRSRRGSRSRSRRASR